MNTNAFMSEVTRAASARLQGQLASAAPCRSLLVSAVFCCCLPFSAVVCCSLLPSAASPCPLLLCVALCWSIWCPLLFAGLSCCTLLSADLRWSLLVELVRRGFLYFVHRLKIVVSRGCLHHARARVGRCRQDYQSGIGQHNNDHVAPQAQ